MINRWLALYWATVLAVLILSLVPTAPELPTTGWDKTNHLLAFAVLFVLGSRPYRRRERLFLGLMLYGGLIEVLQSFTIYRSAEWADLLADVLGLVLGVVVNRLIAVIVARFHLLRPEQTKSL